MLKNLFGKLALLCLLWLYGQVVLAQQAAQPVDALEGLDPVLLVQGKEAQGELTITVTRGKFRYLFVNEANKAAFEKDPAHYEIQLDGACARMGAPVSGIADLYAVHNRRIYIFGSEQCKTLFVAAPEKYLPPARKPLEATPEALKKGKALIEKAVEALGGAARLDALTSYRQQSVSAQSRGPNEVKVQTELLAVFPDRLRLARTMPDYRDPAKTMQQVLVLLPGEEFGIGGPRGMFPVQKGIREMEESRLRLHPLFLLHVRKQPGFKAAALWAERAGVERVAVECNGEPYTLSIEAATGRVLGVSRRQRGGQGSFGELALTFSDFRAVDGLMLPFKITATFDGQPWNEPSAIIESITINGSVDPKLFEKPKTTQ